MRRAAGGAGAGRAVVVGASGFLGRMLVKALAVRMPVLGVARHPPRFGLPEGVAWLIADLSQVPDASFWEAHLSPQDVVVNAAGLLRGPQALLDRVHGHGPIQLFDACVRVGVRRVVQISALGASPEAATAYHRSKAMADRHLLALPLDGVVLRPSLVWGDEGTSAALFARLAVLPLVALPDGGTQQLQPVHACDVTDALVRLVEAELAPRGVIDAVGAEAIDFRHYLQALRTSLGGGRQRVLRLPAAWFLRLASLAARWPGSLLDRDSARMLLQGNAAPVERFCVLLGRAPRSASAFIAPEAAPRIAREAWLAWCLPLLRLSIAVVWLWTAAVSFGIYPRERSLAMLAQLGIEGPAAGWMLLAAATFDLALGLGTLALPGRWRVRLLWPLQLALMAFYTAAISVAMPEFWLHPFGPLSKNVPMAAGIALLWATDAACSARRHA